MADDAAGGDGAALVSTPGEMKKRTIELNKVVAAQKKITEQLRGLVAAVTEYQTVAATWAESERNKSFTPYIEHGIIPVLDEFKASQAELITYLQSTREVEIGSMINSYQVSLRAADLPRAPAALRGPASRGALYRCRLSPARSLQTPVAVAGTVLPRSPPGRTGRPTLSHA